MMATPGFAKGGWAEASWTENAWETAPTQGGWGGWGGWGGRDAEGEGGEDGVSSARAEAPSQQHALKTNAVETSTRRRSPIAGEDWTDEEMIAAMKDYYKSLPRDTFCVDADDLRWPQGDQRSMRLPSSSPLRQELELPQDCETTAPAANIVLEQLYKLFSISLCANTLGQAMIASILNPPKPGEPSYETYKEERYYRVKSNSDRASCWLALCW